jgi:TonB family protein
MTNFRSLFCLCAMFCLCAIGAVSVLSAEVRLSHADAVKNAVKKSVPEYSPVARQMKIQGEVEVEVKITEAGDVADVKAVTGNAMLTSTVIKAVKDWKFTPFTQEGKPAPAVAQMKFSFKL